MFDGSFKGSTDDLAHATCDMLLSTLAGVPGADMAYGMCNCMMENILRIGK